MIYWIILRSHKSVFLIFSKKQLLKHRSYESYPSIVSVEGIYVNGNDVGYDDDDEDNDDDNNNDDDDDCPTGNPYLLSWVIITMTRSLRAPPGPDF